MASRAPFLFTFANLISGIAAIVLALQSHSLAALLCVLAGALFDLGDGWLARRVQSESRLGANADMISDLISFGVAPAILIAVNNADALGYTTATLYFLAIAFRLFRFRMKTPAHREFTGMPSPMTALAASAAVLVEMHWLGGSLFSEIVALFFAMAAVSRVPFPKWGHSCLSYFPRVFWILLWILHGAVFIFMQAEAILSAMFVYLLIGPVTLNRFHRHEAKPSE